VSKGVVCEFWRNLERPCAIERLDSVLRTLVTGERKDPVYALGHSDRELARLSVQAKLFDPLTEQLFRDAGIVPGMRVLDVGSGSGDLAFLAARIVGPSGEVIGADKSPAAVATASRRAAALQL
jgi:tRNA A58 N-methylase Trm61